MGARQLADADAVVVQVHRWGIVKGELVERDFIDVLALAESKSKGAGNRFGAFTHRTIIWRIYEMSEYSTKSWQDGKAADSKGLPFGGRAGHLRFYGRPHLRKRNETRKDVTFFYQKSPMPSSALFAHLLSDFCLAGRLFNGPPVDKQDKGQVFMVIAQLCNPELEENYLAELR